MSQLHVEGHPHLMISSSDPRFLHELLACNGIQLITRCGGKGLCRACRVDLVSGTLQDADGKLVQGPAQGVSACKHKLVVGHPAHIVLPERSLAGRGAQIADSFRLARVWRNNPITTKPFGIAIDIGTTTVAVMLVRLEDGQAVATASALNHQVHRGDNVITRIQLCRENPANIAHLQEDIIEMTLAPLVAQAMNASGVNIDSIGAVTVAGNSTMLHIFAGVDPSPMGVMPFTPVFLEHRVVDLGERLGLNADTPVHLLPGASAYVGADVCAGYLATGMDTANRSILLIDAGTNGEMILVHEGKLSSCATAAGPAFEGSGLTSAVRAQAGAISHLKLLSKDQAEFQVIPGTKPIGLCGSACVDFLAESRRQGLTNEVGRFGDDLGALLVEHAKDGRCYRVPGTQILVSERDISLLLQAKAAIAAGAITLLERVGLTAQDVTLHLAGGFGLHLETNNAIACGLLPGFDPAKVELVGNTSLGGAYLALLDQDTIPAISNALSDMEVVELNLDPGFEMRFVEQMMLP